MIARLALRNWRQHQKLELRFAPVTVITGDNDAGKTGILAAFEMLHANRCQFTDDTGNDQGQLRTAGAADPWTISAELENGQMIVREEKSLYVSWAPQATSIKAAQAALEQVLFGGRSADTVRLALRANRFFGLDESKRKTMLGRLLELEITTERVVTELRRLGEERKLPLLETARDKVGASSLASVERAYKAVYEARTGVNRAMKEATQRRDDLEEAGKEHVWVSKEDGLILAGRHDELQKEIEKLDVEIGGARQRLQNWERLAATGQSDQSDVAQLQRQLESATLPPEVDYTAQLAEIDKTSAELQQLMSEEAEFQKQQGNLKASIARLQTTAEGLRVTLQQAGGCQWAPESPCAGAEARRGQAREQLGQVEAQLEDLTLELLQLRSPGMSPEQIRADLRRCTQKRQAIQQEIDQARSLMVKRNALSQSLAQANQRLTLAEASQLEADRERPAVEKQLADAIKVRDLKADLMADLREELAAARLAHAHKAHLDQARAAYVKLEQEKACLDELCNFFHAAGFPAKVLAECLDPFVESVNSTLAHWRMVADYTNLVLTVSRDGGPFLPYHVLSDSGKIIVGLAHQVAFAVLSQVGIVAIDQIEALDEARQRVLMSACQQVSESTAGLSLILLLGVRCVKPPDGVRHIEISTEGECLSTNPLTHYDH